MQIIIVKNPRTPRRRPLSNVIIYFDVVAGEGGRGGLGGALHDATPLYYITYLITPGQMHVLMSHGLSVCVPLGVLGRAKRKRDCKLT